jgi:A/G-specific adenine glycosylase
LRKRDSVGRNRAVAGGSSPIDAGVGPPDSPDGGRGVALDHDTAWVAGVRERLAAWYAQAARDLPWRADRDPYRILVSELMLIQTTVAAVIPYFERFIGRYPSVAALAAADLAEVLKAWEGLGYYRRARQLHATARASVCNHGGTIPQDPAAVRALPGVGRYIAGAILSFAFDQPEPIVEANSQRVLARLLALRQNLKTAPARERLWQAAERLVPAANAGVFNQALMELGALVCTPREPACLFCPVASFCEFPTIHKEGVDPAGRSLRAADDTVEAVKQLTGITIQVGPPVKTIVYSVTNHRVKLIVHLGKALRGNPRPGPGLVEVRWVEPRDLVEYTFSSAGRRLIGWINQNLDAVMAGL